MVTVFDTFCAHPLNRFNYVDVYPFMCVPDAAGEFNFWPKHVYVVSLVLFDAIFKFRLNNLRVLFALGVAQVICWAQSKVSLVTHPIYFAELTFRRRWLLRQ